jgi:tRNA-binding protein
MKPAPIKDLISLEFNLPDKKMAGEVSQGMLFDIGYADRITPCLAIPEVPVPNGARAG